MNRRFGSNLSLQGDSQGDSDDRLKSLVKQLNVEREEKMEAKKKVKDLGNQVAKYFCKMISLKSTLNEIHTQGLELMK